MLIIAVMLTLLQLLIAYSILKNEVSVTLWQKNINDRLKLRLNSLKKETEMIQETVTATRVLRHDLRHNYRILFALIGEGKVSAALEHIEAQKAVLAEMREE